MLSIKNLNRKIDICLDAMHREARALHFKIGYVRNCTNIIGIYNLSKKGVAV